MTKEQAIEILTKKVDSWKCKRPRNPIIFNGLINKIDTENNAIETVLSMLKENSAEIEQKNTELAEKNAEIEKLKKVLDEKYIFVQGARTVYGRLMSLDKEDIVKDDLALRNEIYQHIEDKEKKDKIIDLMAEHINYLSDELVQATGRNELEFCNENRCCIDSDYSCEQCIKQYFKQKATNNG